MSNVLQPRIDTTSDPHFVLVDGVPILDEHELHVGGSVMKIDAAKLQQIAHNNNRRVAETGDTVMLVHGHTKDDAREEDQPEILGEADKFWVAPLFKTGRMAIWARFKFRKDADVLAKIKKLPRRSVELWTDRWELDPIALLGATAPERDLGVLRLSRIAGHKVASGGKLRYELARVSVPVRYNTQPGCAPSRYEDASMFAQNPPTNGQAMPAQAMPQAAPMPGGAPGMGAPAGQDQGGQMVDPNLLQAVMTGLQGTDVWQQQQALLQQLSSMMQQLQPLLTMLAPMMGQQGGAPGAMPGMGGPGMGGAPGAGPGGMDPMMMAMMAGMGGGMGEEQGGGQQEEQRDDDDRVRMQAGAPGFSTPSATNTFPPSAQTGRTRQTPPRIPYMNTQYQHNGRPVVPQQPQQQQPQIPQVPQAPVQETTEQVLVRLQRRNQQLELENKQLRILFELGALQQEGLELDPQEELPILIQLDDNARAVQYQRMRQRYKNRNERAGLIPGMQQAPIPGAAPGMGQPVPQQYQRGYQQQPRQEAPPTKEEQEQIHQVLCQMRDAGQPLDFGVALHLVRYGRQRRGAQVVPGQEQVY